MVVKKNLKALLGVLMFLSLLIGVCSCEKWQMTTVSYEGVGEILGTVKEEAQDLCSQGTLKPDVCEKIKENYNKAREIYIEAGDVLVGAMKLEGSAEKLIENGKYRDLISNVGTLVKEIVDLLRSSGVRVDRIEKAVKKYAG